MKKEIRNGIRLYFVIPCNSVVSLLKGELVQAWPTSPGRTCPAPRYCPEGGTQIRIDPDKVEVVNFAKGVFTIQRKGAKNDKTAGKHVCSNFFCRAGRALDAESKAHEVADGPHWLMATKNRPRKGAKPHVRKGSKDRRRPLKTNMRIPLESIRHKSDSPAKLGESPMETL